MAEPQEFLVDVSIQETEAHFDALFAQASSGDHIVFPQTRGFEAMYPHAHGVIIKNMESSRFYRLNGVRSLYCGSVATPTPHPDGMLLEIKSKSQYTTDTWVLLNGTKLLFASEGSDALAHPRGVVMSVPDGRSLNGTKRLVAGRVEVVGVHPDGVLVDQQSGEGHRQIALNGERVVYEGSWDRILTDMYGRTVVIAGSQNHSRFTSIGLGRLYDGPYSEAYLHPRGVVIRTVQGGHERYTLNGETILYDSSQHEDLGPIKKVHDHLRGVVIEVRRKSDVSLFLLDGSIVLYEGEYDSVVMHPEGVLVRKGSQIFLSVYKSFDSDKIV